LKNSAQDILKITISDGILSGLAARDIVPKKLSGLMVRLSFSLVFVILMWISANSFFYLPFTPIPVTMQVLTVLISALTLGGYWAAFSMMEYVFLGLMGAPVFAGFKSGLTAITGPTGGFIIGFIAAALGAGLIFRSILNKYTQMQAICPADRYPLYIILSSLSGILIIYATGYLHFTGYLYLLTGLDGKGSLFLMALKLAVMPFIIIDLMKVFIVLFIYRVFLYEKN
jgi:biotin transport system substrate-specific component